MTNEERKQRIEKILKLVGLGVVGFIVSPVIFATIQGLVGLIVAAAIGLFAVNVAVPWYAMKIANWRLKAMKAEAAKNPVETLQNQYLEKEKQVEKFSQHIIDFSTAVENFAQKLKIFEKDYPDEAPQMREQLSKTRQLLSNKRQKLVQANEGLKAFKAEIKKVGAKWQIAQEAMAMNQAAGMTDESFMEQMIKETAIESVTTSLNRALAEIDAELIEDARTMPQLTESQARALPVQKEAIGISV